MRNNDEILNACARLLRFYDLLLTHENYSEVNKSDFYQLTKRYRNDRKKAKERDIKILANSYVSLDRSSSKKIAREEIVSSQDMKRLTDENETNDDEKI